MKALTLWRPWTQCILFGPKRVENRPWAPDTSMRAGDVFALHAGEKWDSDGERYMRTAGFHPPMNRDDEPAGAIVGVATFLGAYTVAEVQRSQGFPPWLRALMSPPWGFGPQGWVLDDVRALAIPVECRGAQGLWPVPEDVEAQVRALL